MILKGKVNKGEHAKHHHSHLMVFPKCGLVGGAGGEECERGQAVCVKRCKPNEELPLSGGDYNETSGSGGGVSLHQIGEQNLASAGTKSARSTSSGSLSLSPAGACEPGNKCGKCQNHEVEVSKKGEYLRASSFADGGKVGPTRCDH